MFWIRGYPGLRRGSVDPRHGRRTRRRLADIRHMGRGEQGYEGRSFRGRTQITLQHTPDQYSDFRIFNIVANGYAWNLTPRRARERSSRQTKAIRPVRLPFELRDVRLPGMRRPDVGPQNRVAYYYRDFHSPGGLEVSRLTTI